MQMLTTVVLAFFLSLVFTIGLNLGMHGILSSSTGNSISHLTETILSSKNGGILHESSSHLHLQGTEGHQQEPKQQQEVESQQTIHQPTTTTPTSVVPHSDAVDTRKSVIAANQAPDAHHYKSQKAVDEVITSVLSSEDYQSKLKATYDICTSDASGQGTEISEYLKVNKKLPIVLLTNNRFELLSITLSSLLAVKGIAKEDIIVIQDGTMPEVAQVVRNAGLRLVQNTAQLHLRGGVPPDGAARIAMHYRFSLTKIFELKPTAPAVIVVEDDLLFSPDFYEYFTNVAPVVELDPSVMAVSAWSDNGFIGHVNDNFALRRTGFFPGLGWLLSRKLYKSELENTWPEQHWDHWLRSWEVNRGREIVFPEVPRSFHNGIKGTFMTLDMHNQYFRDIDFNKNGNVTWKKAQQILQPSNLPLFGHALKDTYENRIQLMVSKCTHASSTLDIIKAKGIICIWIELNPESEWGEPEFKPISEFFGLWHEHKRGHHNGLHEFYWDDKYVLIMNLFAGPHMRTYRGLMPSTASIMKPNMFNRRMIDAKDIIDTQYEVFAADRPGITCNAVCRQHSKQCSDKVLTLINTCEALQAKFPCTSCLASYGSEQPAFVVPNAPARLNPGVCVFNSDPSISRCDALHVSTQRLCACV